jgi:flagellar basal body-associated protein FliL
MSDPEEKKKEAAAPATKKKGGGGAVVAILLPALLAGGGAFGGAKFSTPRAVPSGPAVEHAAVVPPPGPTLALEPFLVVTLDATKKPHAMKVTIAVEFEAAEKVEALKDYTPRVRDASLAYLRLLSYEDALDSGKTDKMRADLLERYKTAGAAGAQRVLVTDLVVQ